jgi:hypothetical protein
MDTKALSFDYDMATMALKGQRFREAEEKFKDLAMRTNSVEAWCGIALSKYGLIMDDTSISEVFYCFDKAKAASTEDNKEDLVTVIQQSSFECAGHLYDLYVKTVLATRKAEVTKSISIVATAVGGFSTLNAANNNKIMGTIASAGFTAFSYDSYLKSHASAQELKNLQGRVVDLIEQIKAHVKDYLQHSDTRHNEFTQLISQKEAYVIDSLKTEDQKALEKVKGINSTSVARNGNWWETASDDKKDSSGNSIAWYNKQSVLFLSIFIWPVFLYGLYKTELITRKTKMRGVIVIAILFVILVIISAASEPK